MNLHTNPSFEQPWQDMLPIGALVNQQPQGYALRIRNVGAKLVSCGFRPDDDPVFETVTVIPECVHKLRHQLPEAETGPGGLIRTGNATYKLFAAHGAFSADLSYSCLVPAKGRIHIAVPVQVHQHGDGSPGAAVWRLLVNGAPQPWLTFRSGITDRAWVTQDVDVDLDAGSLLTVVLQVESRSLAGIDFFTDDWVLDLNSPLPPGEGPGVRDPAVPGAWYDARSIVVDYDLIRDPATRRAYYLQACNRGIVVGPSHDHAASWPPGAKSLTVELPCIPTHRHQAFLDYYHGLNPSINVQFVDIPSPTPPPTPPPISPLPPGEGPGVGEPLPATLIGLHSQRPQTGWLDFYHKVKPSIFKGFELGMCVEAKRASPETLVIYRKHVSDDGRWINTPDRKASALTFLDLTSRELELHAKNSGIGVSELLKSVDVIESVNEVIGTWDPDLEPAVEFDCHFAESIRVRYGHQVSAGLLTIAVGNPHEEEVIKLLPAAEQSYRHGHYLGYHAYWSGDRSRDYLESHWQWLAGRWMEWDKVFASKAVFPSYYSGESGLVFSRSGDGWNLDSGHGWKACGPFLDYIRQILAFQTRCRSWNASHSNRFRGAVLFCYGGYGWESFDFEPGDLHELGEALRAAA